MCNARLWPQECLKGMCKRIQHIVALRFGDGGTREMWGLVGSKVWPVSNFAQQFPTTRKNMQQHDATGCAKSVRYISVTTSDLARRRYGFFYEQQDMSKRIKYVTFTLY